MAFEDNILTDVRADLRQLRQLAETYRLQQRAVELAYSQVDNARSHPPGPARPGVGPRGGRRGGRPDPAAAGRPEHAAAGPERPVHRVDELPDRRGWTCTSTSNFSRSTPEGYGTMSLSTAATRPTPTDPPPARPRPRRANGHPPAARTAAPPRPAGDPGRWAAAAGVPAAADGPRPRGRRAGASPPASCWPPACSPPSGPTCSPTRSSSSTSRSPWSSGAPWSRPTTGTSSAGSRPGRKGTYASTIRWVIDDGSIVQKGQMLMELDDSSLQEQYRTQAIVVDKARAEWITADENYTITVKRNESRHRHRGGRPGGGRARPGQVPRAAGRAGAWTRSGRWSGCRHPGREGASTGSSWTTCPAGSSWPSPTWRRSGTGPGGPSGRSGSGT